MEKFDPENEAQALRDQFLLGVCVWAVSGLEPVRGRRAVRPKVGGISH